MTKLPAEWERHHATWMAWPYDTVSFPDRIEAVEREYIRIIGALSENETVKLVVRSFQKREVLEKLASGSVATHNVEFFEAEYADVWTRDWGPTFANIDGEAGFIKWTYNAYGNRFPELLKDDTAVDKIDEFKKFKRVDAGFVMEGGAIEWNGEGTLLMTEETLLNINRNAGMSREHLEKRFEDLLGAKNCIWLKRGLLNDHTDGHIDEVARFVSADTILYAWTKEGENYKIMDENLEILKGARDAEGRSFNLVPLEIPSIRYEWGDIAPASYCNFYIANNVVLVPQFGVEADRKAKATIAKAFPGRTILGVDSSDLLYGGGGLHCITQQEPMFT